MIDFFVEGTFKGISFLYQWSANNGGFKSSNYYTSIFRRDVLWYGADRLPG